MQPDMWELRVGQFSRPRMGLQDAGTLAPAQLVEACRTAIRREDWGEAVLLADQGLGSETLTPEQEGILRFSAGVAVMYLGDLFRAERELYAFLRLSESEPALRIGVGPAMYNLGYLYRTLGRPEQEVQWFMKALIEYEETGNADRAAATLVEIAWCYLCWGKADDGHVYLERAAARVRPLSENHALLHLGWALYFSICGKVTESNRWLKLLESGGSLPARVRAEVHWILGGNLLARGDTEGAALQVDLAYEAALADWWPEQLNRIDALRTRIRRRRHMA